MAILGNTTLITGKCYGDFITDGTLLIGTSSKLSNIPSVTSSDSNPLQVNGYAVASGYKVNGLTDANTYLLTADGGHVTAEELVGDFKSTNYVAKIGDTMTGNLKFYVGASGNTTSKYIRAVYTDPDLGDLEGAGIRLDQSKITLISPVSVSTLTAEGTITANKCNSTTGFFQTSDIKKKTNFRDLNLDKCYELIDKCQTVLFDYKEGAKDQMGMIALEVEEFFPEIVSTDADGFKSLDYAKLTVVILRVLKDLIKKVNGLN